MSDTPVETVRGQVAIIGAGPAGLLLAQLLAQGGVESVILERRSREYVEGRIRAGVLEQGAVETLRAAGVAGRLDAEGLVHRGAAMMFEGRRHRIDFQALTGKAVTVYGQTEITKDLIEARLAAGQRIEWEAEDVSPRDVTSARPAVFYTREGRTIRLDCEIVAGCDGFLGVCRQTIPAEVLRTYERVYPFGWLGLLADVPPCDEELIYSSGEAGFALCSMRSPTRSRYYIQCDADEDVGRWSDERFWLELERRVGPEVARTITRGPSLEKSVAKLRSFVAEPLRHGALFLAGDAAHIVPPTGAKGLNLAIADVSLLAEALIDWFRHGRTGLTDGYSAQALARIWKAERFSAWMTQLLHRYPDHSPFDRRMQRAEFDYLADSETASRGLAENYVGLPAPIRSA